MTVPQHIAIIMDGNGRWAEAHNRPRLYGHKAGVASVREVVETARELGVGYMTLYAFSTENWKRPDKEVSGLMFLLKNYLHAELKNMVTNDIRLHCIGQRQRLPEDVRSALEQTIERTRSCTGMTLTLALSYGGRAELVRGVQSLARACANGEISAQDIDAKAIDKVLYTVGQPDPDLLIRTGGEYRLSNFLLWQASYAELYFTETMWPEFRKEQLLEAIVVFNHRQRRFGKTGAQLQAE
ncbi:MAG: isoprenyl transferase [Desulfobulbus propionicus]|nr:MAG: isoprenyl transferase [Desulfobulbus propionicus]